MKPKIGWTPLAMYPESLDPPPPPPRRWGSMGGGRPPGLLLTNIGNNYQLPKATLVHSCTVVENQGGGGSMRFWPNSFEGVTWGFKKI